jgi:hypothetical protein
VKTNLGEFLRFCSVVQVLAAEVLERNADVLARKFATPVHVVVNEDTTSQCTLGLSLSLNGGSRLEENLFSEDKSPSTIFPIEVIASDLFVGRVLIVGVVYRIVVHRVAVTCKWPKAVW